MEWEVGERVKREETDVYLWLLHVVWQKPTQHCKAIIFQLKKAKQPPLLLPRSSQAIHKCLTFAIVVVVNLQVKKKKKKTKNQHDANYSKD